LGSKLKKCGTTLFVLFEGKEDEGNKNFMLTEPNKIMPKAIMPFTSFFEKIKKAFQDG
jgi:hypothetical protein